MNIQTNIATILFIIIPSLVGFSQEKPTSSWNLKDCIDYARKNNIQVQSAKVTQQSANVDLLQAKAQLFPSLTFSSAQGWGHQKINTFHPSTANHKHGTGVPGKHG